MDEPQNSECDSVTALFVGSLRKRPFEVAVSVGLPSELDRVPKTKEESDVMEFSPKYAAGTNAVLDEIELHFQRSLSQPKTKRKSPNEREVPCQDSRISFQKSQHSEEQEEEICTDVSDSSAMKTDTSTKLENSGLSIVTVDSRQQIEVPQMPTLPRSVRSLISDRVSCVNTTIPSVLQQNLQPPSRKPNEIVKVVPSRTVNPIIHTSHSTSTPTGFKVGVSGTQSGTVQVIDLTRRDLSDTLVSRNGLAAAPSVSQTRSLQIGGTSRLPNEAGVNSVGTVKALGKSKDLVSSIITRNGSTSSGKVGAPIGNPVILLPTPGNVGSAAMVVQPQPYILVNPAADMSHHTTVLGAPGVYCGGGSGYILLSPNHTVPNSLLQVVSSAGVCVTHSGVNAPATVPSSQLTFISAPKQTSFNSSSKVTSFVSDGNKKDDINVMPASVEDHFAKALGDQWSKLSSGSNGSSSSSTVKTS